MGHLFLLVAVISLGCLGILHKVADHRKCRPQAINLVLFLVASVTLTAFTSFRLGPAAWARVPLPAWAVAAACGLCASLAILTYPHGVRYGRISTCWLIITLSAIVPTFLSIAVYKETVEPRRAASLALAALALLLLWVDRRREESGRL